MVRIERAFEDGLLKDKFALLRQFSLVKVPYLRGEKLLAKCTFSKAKKGPVVTPLKLELISFSTPELYLDFTSF